jgi:hypothetical protein
MKTAVTTSTKALLASLEISYLIAKNKKPHTIGETLLLQLAIKVCEIMDGENYSQALKAIPFSKSTMMQQTESMSEDIKEQLLIRNKYNPKFSLQINKSTDVASLPCLLMSVRYSFKEKHS